MQGILKNKKLIFTVLVVVAAAVLVFLAFNFTPVKRELTIEAGGLKTITADEFKQKTKYEVALVTDISKIELNKAGEHTVEFTFKNKCYKTKLHIVDTTAPTATAVNCNVYKGTSPKAEAFVKDIKDCSAVTVSFVGTPDFATLGEKTLKLKLTDSFNNTGEITVKYTVINDTTPPEFEGLSEISVRVGETVSYRSGVTVKDNLDGEVTFSFDSSSVNLQKAGEYKVTYSATDSVGNTATAERTVKVLPKLLADEETVKGLARKVISQIITDDMTKHEKIDKIFKWMRSNINYVGSPETDYLNAAYVGFTKRRGDCYNYYAMTKMLLDECGIENMMVERYGGKTTHFWHLVNVGTGWYHYDTTPQSLQDPYRCFMETDEQVFAYARSRHDGRSDYYNFDASKYPERATERYTAN